MFILLYSIIVVLLKWIFFYFQPTMILDRRRNFLTVNDFKETKEKVMIALEATAVVFSKVHESRQGMQKLVFKERHIKKSCRNWSEPDGRFGMACGNFQIRKRDPKLGSGGCISVLVWNRKWCFWGYLSFCTAESAVLIESTTYLFRSWSCL